jgi:hypothetical protein
VYEFDLHCKCRCKTTSLFFFFFFTDSDWSKQDRRIMYNVTMRGVHETIVAVDRQ